MSINIMMEICCDGCGIEGFSGSFYSKKEVYDELRNEGWKLKRGKPESIINPWFFYCPKCVKKNRPTVEFKSLDTYRIDDDTTCYVVKCDKKRDNFDDFFPHVIIDGEKYEVAGVERHCHAGPVRKGSPIGIWARKSIH